MKALYIFPLAILAALGISINSAYYFDSFVTAGYPVLFALGLSGSYMGLESVLWLYPGAGWYLPVLKVAIIFFSISATLGSQFFSTSQLEADINKTIYEEIGTSEAVDYYLEQIKKQDDRIDSIYREREEKTIYTLSQSSLENAELKKSEYEKKLEEARRENEIDFQEITKPLSIYSFYAYRIPEIINGDRGEDFIRVLFQLFSSVILALVAPICLSMIKVSASPGDKELGATGEVEIEKGGLTDHDKARITKMLLYFYPEHGVIIDSEKAAKHFQTLKKGNGDLKEYSVSECEEVRIEVLKHDGKEKDEIIKEVLL